MFTTRSKQEFRIKREPRFLKEFVVHFFFNLTASVLNTWIFLSSRLSIKTAFYHEFYFKITAILLKLFYSEKKNWQPNCPSTYMISGDIIEKKKRHEDDKMNF